MSAPWMVWEKKPKMSSGDVLLVCERHLYI